MNFELITKLLVSFVSIKVEDIWQYISQFLPVHSLPTVTLQYEHEFYLIFLAT